MIDLPQVNLVTVVYNDNASVLAETIPVLLYMNSVAKFGKTTLFTATPAPHLPGIEVIQIWPTDAAGHSWWLSRIVRLFVRQPFAMFCQNDGFILDPSRWEPAFLDYDYIGAPWEDGVVGNEGFSIQSQRFLWAKAQIDWDGKDGQDWFYCRTAREEMMRLGVTYAPTEVAARFSSELCDHDKPTLGYHGRGYSPEKHKWGQELLRPYVHAR